MLETRSATVDDAALIASHRRAMFASMGGFDAKLLDPGAPTLPNHGLTRMIAEGKYLGWITMDEARPIASAGMLILDWPPHPLDPDGEDACLSAQCLRRGGIPPPRPGASAPRTAACRGPPPLHPRRLPARLRGGRAMCTSNWASRPPTKCSSSIPDPIVNVRRLAISSQPRRRSSRPGWDRRCPCTVPPADTGTRACVIDRHRRVSPGPSPAVLVAISEPGAPSLFHPHLQRRARIALRISRPRSRTAQRNPRPGLRRSAASPEPCRGGQTSRRWPDPVCPSRSRR